MYYTSYLNEKYQIIIFEKLKLYQNVKFYMIFSINNKCRGKKLLRNYLGYIK